MKRLEMGVQAFDVRPVLEMVERGSFEHLVLLSQISTFCDEPLMFTTQRVGPIADHALIVPPAIISRICD
jgi:hypothetical protein